LCFCGALKTTLAGELLLPYSNVEDLSIELIEIGYIAVFGPCERGFFWVDVAGSFRLISRLVLSEEPVEDIVLGP